MRETKDNRLAVFGLVAAMVIVGAIATAIAAGRAESGTDSVDSAALASLAACLKESGAKFYGAEWCSHCQKQKKDFGSAAKALPYVECGDKNSPTGQAQECADAGIASYPTWVFGDGSRVSGEVGLEELAARSGCQLLANVSAELPQAVITGIETVPTGSTSATE